LELAGKPAVARARATYFANSTALTAGTLKDIINAPSTASFEGSSGEMFATGTIDLMMKTKPDSQALKDYQA
jgi:hypothetical protein